MKESIIDMTQNMRIVKFIRLIFVFAVLFFGTGSEMFAQSSFSIDQTDIVVTPPGSGTVVVKSTGGIVENSDGSHTVTIVATPNGNNIIKRGDIKVQKLLDPAASPARRRTPDIADYLTVEGPETTTTSGEYRFTVPNGYQGAYIVATFRTVIMIPSSTTISYNSNGYYMLTADVSASDLSALFTGSGATPFEGIFEGVAKTDGTYPIISDLNNPLFAKINGGVVKNVILEDVTISGGTNAGAIANVAEGASRIYNCGVNGGSVSGSGNVGSIVGSLEGTSRVINCYSFADVSGGSNVGGIVGYNSVATTAATIATGTMVMNCMFYGDIKSGTKVSPVYGGNNIDNKHGGLATYNYYAYDNATTFKGYTESANKKYNCALAVEGRFLKRFEIYRQLLNSNRRLAAYYATDDAANADQMAKWVLETADRTIDSPKPYPILKKQGKYPSIINYDIENAPDSATVGRKKGGKLASDHQSLTVNISIGSNYPTGAQIKSGKSSFGIDRTDMDEDHFNYNYDKIQLPYYNDVGTKNYTGNKVVTGWKITGMSKTGSSSYDTGDKWGGYNFADRNCTDKDLYGTSGRVFSQGAYFDVPYGVTSIDIEPYWADAAYVADEYLDVVYSKDYVSQPVSQLGKTFGTGKITIDGSEQTVYTSINDALTNISSSGSKVYDRAVVLVGNFHQSVIKNTAPFNGSTAFTLMSVDLDHDNEPDYSLIYNDNDRSAVCPIRFDFLNIPGTAQAQKPNDTSAALRNAAVFDAKSWFEITNTCLIYFSQFEYENNTSKTGLAPIILLGGVYDQFVSTKVSAPKSTTYIHVGGNAWFKDFGNGTHSDGELATKHIPISVTGGDYKGFYLTGNYNADAGVSSDNAECYISGGHFKELAGAGLEQINGNVQWQIYDADIDNFFGGGINDAKPILGTITTNIYNSHVGTFCGGPKFGNMAADKKVKTTAVGCTFDKYFGAGYGGNSIMKKKYYDASGQPTWSTRVGDYTGANGDKGKYYNGINTNANDGFPKYGKKGPGVATDFDYEYFVWTSGTVGARFFVKFAAFSLAKCNDVESNLTDCIINSDFYGGGSLGIVTGTAKSVLDGCTVHGNVFGGGYSASIPKIPVRDGGFKTGKAPKYNSSSGMFELGELSDSTDYDWVHVDNLPADGGDGFDGQKVKTDADLTTLGQVANTDVTIKGNTYIQGYIYDYDDDGKVIAGSGEQKGGVFGGGDASDVTGNTSVTIVGSRSEGIRNVYGGGNTADVLGNDTISVVGGKMIDVYGGGLGQPTTVQGKVIVNIGKKFNKNGALVSEGTPEISGNVYGGSALGAVNATKTITNAETGAFTLSYNSGATTAVTLYKGTITGNVFGGGLGQQDVLNANNEVTTPGIAANVYGPVTVTVEGGSAKNVFGCNNLNGTPKSTVTVTINGTAASTGTGDNKVYALQGVYGGGNLAHYDPTTPGEFPTVTVNGCSTSIKDVFGGGNAAAVPYTSVTINGGDIDRVFAGGNGSSGAANVGYKNSKVTPTAGEDEYGTGTSNAIIAGGTINEIYGGSNNKGTVRAAGTMSIAKSTAAGACPMKIGSVYGGGNEASGAAVALSIGCTGTGDDEGITNVFGGANAANVTGNILLTITEGKIANVFGGNNSSGSVSGTITVNINKAASPCVWDIGNVFGGGKDAAYSTSNIPEGLEGLEYSDETAANYYKNFPKVNIKNGTVGNVFGGGQGSGATVTGNPQVTIGDATDGYDADVTGDVYGGGDAAAVVGTPAIHVINKDNTSIGNVYGGGNAADVSATSVTIDGGTIGMVFGGGHGDKASLNGENESTHSDKIANVTGNVNVSVTGGTITKVFAGSNLNGSIGGTVELGINKAAAARTMKIGEVYGGGNQAAGNAGEITIGCTGTWTETGENNHTNHNSTTNRIGYELEGIGTVYGGANAADVGNDITLNITGGIVENVFGGNNTSGSIDGDITVNIEKGDATCSWYVGNVYGGGNLAAYSQKTAGHPAVNIKNGTVSGSVYGGGKGSTAVVTGNPVVTIGDATATHVAIVTGDVYGGGDAAAVTGNTTVTYNDNNTSSTVARLFGGGNAAGVSGTSTVTMTLGKVTGGVYGGCNSSGSVGAVTIALNGGQVGTDATHRADVYGGGLGSSTTTTGDIGVTLGTDASTGTNVYGDIYGGSALGSVNSATADPANTTTVTLTSATLYGSVFGGGKGDNASEGDGHSDVTATSNGGATVNINVANTHLTGIYGGANVRGNVKGAIAVNINANVGATGTGNSLDIFGGGYGANTNTEGNVTVTIGDADGTYQPVIYGDIYGGSALGNVNNDASDITTVNFLNGTLHGDLYGGGLGNAGNAAKVNGKVIVNISNEDQLASNCHIDLREASIYGCNNANGSPQDDVTVNIYKTDHTSDNGISGTAYAIDQVFGGGDQADYAPENGSASSTKKATVNIIGCNNTIRRVFGGGNAAAAVGVVTRIDGGHFDYVYGGGNGEVTAANIGAGGTNLQIHGGNINNLFGGSNAQGTITGNMGVTVDNACDCEGSGGTAQYVNEFFCGNNLASIGTAQNPVTINATIACGTRFGAVYGGCNLAPLYGSVNLTVEGGVMDYVYGGSKGRLADNSDPTNLIQALAADISGDVTLTIKGGQIKNVFGGSNINGNIAGSIEVNIEKDDASTCNDGWYVGNVYGASNLAAYTPNDGKTLKVNIKNGTVNGNVYGGGKGESAIVTSNPVVTIGDVTAGHERYVAKVEDKDGDTEADGTTAMVGGNVYGGGDAAPVVGNTTVTYNDNNASTTVANIFGGGNNASVSGNATVTLKGKATVEQNVFGGGNKGIVQGKATVNIEE